MKNIFKLIVIFLTVGLYWSCSETDLEPTLSQSKDVESSIKTAEDLQAVLNGMYNRVSASTYYGRNVIIYGEVRSDNTYSNANSNRFVTTAQMQMTIQDGEANSTWSQIYSTIASANIVIEDKVLEGDPTVINHIRGQAYAMRALAHFDLLRFFGQQHVNGGGMSALGVPYVTDFRNPEALVPARNTVQEVLTMCMQDLDMAASMMSKSLDNTSRVYLTTDGVNAIKARIALYFGDWNTALAAANAVIGTGAYTIVPASGFVASYAMDSSPNSIFEIAASEVDNNGNNGLQYIYQETNYGDVVALADLANIYEAGDVRGVGGIISVDSKGNYRNTGKYPTLGTYDDNIPVFRIEEMYLIKAEALLELGQAGAALTELNRIPANRGASLYSSATKANILLERRKELAFEGFRFDDLARTQSDIPLVDGARQTHGGPKYGSYNYAFPIPAFEINANSSMIQNSGY